MGLCTLIELNHDTAHRIFEHAHRDIFLKNLATFISSGDSVAADRLYLSYDTKVIATRHSSDRYYISRSIWGFPANLPHAEYNECVEKQRQDAIQHAKEILETIERHPRKRNQVTKDELLDILAALIAPEVEDD